MDEDYLEELPLFRRIEIKNDSRLEAPTSQEFAGRHFGKYIVYVDESGDHSMQTIDANYPIFVLELILKFNIEPKCLCTITLQMN